MDRSENWQQVEELFHDAIAKEPADRTIFLDKACGGNARLRLQVESLIVAHDREDHMIDFPVYKAAAEMLTKEEQLKAGQAVGHYQICSVLGAGGMGVVYLAQDTQLNRRIALKVLPPHLMIDPERVRRFELEARAISALNHPNIVTIHEIGFFQGTKFIVTEFVEGHTLRQLIVEREISLRKALDLTLQVANALAVAHAAGVVHRDIKPENIIVRSDGYVKVLDFGLAKLTESNGTAIDTSLPTRIQTEAGVVMGTATYMSPEQARGVAIDARSDIFSLGVVLYEMVSGRAPFEGATISDVIAAVLKEEPQPLRSYSPDVPSEFEWVVKKALAKDCDERYQTVRDLQIDLKRLKQELESQSKLQGIASIKPQHEQPARSSLQSPDNFTSEVRPAASTVKSLIVNDKRSRALRILAVFAASIVFVGLSVVLYSGLKRRPPRVSYPNSRQLTFRRGTISSARLAADGNTLIYSAAFDGKPVQLFTSRLESPESSSLQSQIGGRTAGIQSISSTGELAILLDCELNSGECINGTLARMPLAGGAPREIIEKVSEADWSPDGKELAIVRVLEGQYQLEYPIGKVLYKASGSIDHPRVSPKGDEVALIEHSSLTDTKSAIIVVNLNGTKKTLSDGWQEAKGVAWSPAGDEVWFSAGKTRVVDLHAVTLAGDERTVFQAPGDLRLYDIGRDGRVLLARGDPRSRMIASVDRSNTERDLSWFDWSTSADLSADGNNLLFYEWGMAVGGLPYVYLRKSDGSSDPVRLGQGKALALSPDGKWALTLQEGPPSQLVLLPTGPGEPRPLPRADIKEYDYASWFPDGEQILFTGLADTSRPLRSYVQDISGGQPRPVTAEGMIALSVSPDGKQLLGLASDRNSDGRYYLCPADGTSPTPITGLGLGGVPIQWSADGRALYEREDSDFESEIYKLDLLNGKRILLKKIVPDPVGMIGIEVKPGGVKITPDGKSYVYTYWTVLQELFVVEGLR